MGKVGLKRPRKSAQTYFVVRKGSTSKFTKTLVKRESHSTNKEVLDLVHQSLDHDIDDQVLPPVPAGLPLPVPPVYDTNDGNTNTNRPTEYHDDYYDQDKPQTPSSSLYFEKKNRRINHWHAIYNKLLTIGTSIVFVPPQHSCIRCNQKGEVIRCLDCGPSTYLCKNCLDNQHLQPHLHKFELFKNGTYIDFECKTPTWKRLDGHICNVYKQDIIVMDEKGRQHKREIEFCTCETKAETMMRFFLWPSSPKNPTIGFHFQLLELMTALLYESQVSAKSFCQVIQRHHKGVLETGVKDVYKILMNECLVQYRKFNYQIEHPNHIIQVDNGMSCPACYQNPQKIISFDADFQLVRKLSSGQSTGRSKQNGFFEDQTAVDKFVENYGNKKELLKESECNEFQAGSALRSKGKNKKLDETAVFGSICRHEFPVKFFSLKHGERLSYSVFLIEKLLKEYKDSQLSIMYDIACRLHNHLKANDRNDLLDRVNLAIPIFHGYAHQISCQVLFNPRRLTGFGLTDGECVERMWSYLGKFSNITKEMTPENRVDLLDMALVFYGAKTTSKLGKTMSSKFHRAESLKQTSEKLLNEILQSLPGHNEIDVKQWSDNEVNQHNKKIPNQEEMFTPFEDYVIKLTQFYVLKQSSMITADMNEKENLTKKIRRIESELVKYERTKQCGRLSVNCEAYLSAQKSINHKKYSMIYGKIKKRMVERLYFLQLMKKYARGQAVALRLGKQLKKINKCIKTHINEYNACPAPKQHPYPNELSFNELELKVDVSNDSVITEDIKRMAVDLYETILRCTEEIGMVKTEMNCCLKYFQSCHQSLCEQLLMFDENAYVERSVTITKGITLEYSIKQLMKLLPQVVTANSEVKDTFHDIIAIDTKIPEQMDNMLLSVNSELGIDFENYVSDSDDEQNELDIFPSMSLSDDTF